MGAGGLKSKLQNSALPCALLLSPTETRRKQGTVEGYEYSRLSCGIVVPRSGSIHLMVQVTFQKGIAQILKVGYTTHARRRALPRFGSYSVRNQL